MPSSESRSSSNCTVELLLAAAQSAYRITDENSEVVRLRNDYTNNRKKIGDNGYSVSDEYIVPQSMGGKGTTPLVAVCLLPQDNKGPIIISFRGTKTMEDVVSDVRLVATGQVESKLRDAAFEFYEVIKSNNKGREIILTGHSLGGHLAQYVATRAYDADKELRANPSLQVRTFNTAPIDTIHGRVFNRVPGLGARFVNYRTSSDLVSDLPRQDYYGNTFSFPSSTGSLTSHGTAAIGKNMPDDIKGLQVGGGTTFERDRNILFEQARGMLLSYECRVNGQFFSRYRAGAKNLKAMQADLPKVILSLQSNDFDKAEQQLTDLSKILNGKVSKNIIEVLKKSTEKVKRDLEENQKNIKSDLKKLTPSIDQPQDNTMLSCSSIKTGPGP